MKNSDLSGAKTCKSCRSRQELSNEYLLGKFGVDTAENEPLDVLYFRTPTCSMFVFKFGGILNFHFEFFRNLHPGPGMTGLRAVSDAGSAAWTTGVANAMMDTLWSRGSDGRSFLSLTRLSASAKAALGTALAVTAEALGPAMTAAATPVTSSTRKKQRSI